MLNATWIETFTVLAEEGHFTRAAQRLNMTQPGVSQHLRKLEQQLGQPLIVQSGKGFTLTAAGAACAIWGWRAGPRNAPCARRSPRTGRMPGWCASPVRAALRCCSIRMPSR